MLHKGDSLESNSQSRTFQATTSAISKSVLCAKGILHCRLCNIIQNVLLTNADY